MIRGPCPEARLKWRRSSLLVLYLSASNKVTSYKFKVVGAEKTKFMEKPKPPVENTLKALFEYIQALADYGGYHPSLLCNPWKMK